MKKSYLSPKVEKKKSVSGFGLFATENVSKGEIVADFSNGPGQYLSTAQADVLYDQGKDYMMQVDNDTFFVATTPEELEDADFINHSCDPTCGIRGTQQVVAMRNIRKGEEITFDYAMTESSDFSFSCECGAQNCRHVVTGEDWKLPELQKKYKGYFSDYLQKRIDRAADAARS